MLELFSHNLTDLRQQNCFDMKVLANVFFCFVFVAASKSVYGRRLGESDDDEACPEISTFANFDRQALEAYTSAKWYVHEQAVTTYLPKENNYCVTAEYEILPRKTFWGYTIRVNNNAKNLQGDEFGGILYATQSDPKNEPAKLKVAPGFLPQFFAGPYWILDYQEEKDGKEGYALIVGGQPNVRTENGCKTKNRWITSSGGLWIFTRNSVRNDELVAMVKSKAANEFGLDVTVLNRVDHTDPNLCGY